MKRKRLIQMGIVSIALIGIGIIGYTAVSAKGNDKGVPSVTEAEAKENNKEEKEKEEKKSEFVDDSKVVAKITADLLTGKATYPVREDGKKVVYLTFDDGPSDTNTPRVLDILKKEDVKATFFLLGERVDNTKGSNEIIKKMDEEGHAIANHTYTHNYRKLYPNGVINPDEFMKEFNRTNDAIKKILGEDYKVNTVRFPGGYWSWNGRENARKRLDKEGVNIVDWNALNGDAVGKSKNAKELINESKKNLDSLGKDADQVVFLLHDTYGKETTVEALPGIIKMFKDRGFEFRTMK